MRVLVSDPNPNVRRLIRHELEAAGIATLDAESLDDALRLAREDLPDAIVMNATCTPGLGARFVRELRADGTAGHVPVVGIAFVPAAVQPLLDAGVSCCLRAFPAKGEVLKAVTWVVSVYGEGRDQ